MERPSKPAIEQGDLFFAADTPPPARPVSGPTEPAQLCVLLMVHELHRCRHQLLRIVPGMSTSGTHWRVTLLPRSRVLRRHGALSHDWTMDGPDPFYTSGQERCYFGWKDAQADQPAHLAAKLLERFPETAKAAKGEDAAYVAWYVEVLAKARLGELPVAYADWYEKPDPRWLPTTRGFESGLAMPPPGEAKGSVHGLPKRRPPR